MITEHPPEWALDMAIARLNAEGASTIWGKHHYSVLVLARLIAEHIPPPDDPDEDDLRAILENWEGNNVKIAIGSRAFRSALALFKAALDKAREGAI